MARLDSLLFSTSWGFISTFLIFNLGFILALKMGFYFKCSVKRAVFIYIWHSLFSIFYLFYVINNGGDALVYYDNSFNQAEFGVGTKGVVFLTSFLTQWIKLPLIGCFLVFHFFGFVGLLAFDASLRWGVKNKGKGVQSLASLIVFLPSVSFWSSAIGKDSISFMAVGLALWASLQLNKRITLMIFSIILMLFVRPHMAGLMVMGLAVSFIFQKNIPFIHRLFLGTTSLVVVAILVPFALSYAGVGEKVDAEMLGDYIDKRQSYNTEGGGGVDLSSMTFPMQLFTYMFRPLPFEAHSIASLMASLDNMVLLYLCIVGSYCLIKTRLTSEYKLHNRAFMWFYLMSSWSVLSMTSANLGIAMRQKWMIAPMLIFLLLSVIGNENSRSNYEN